MNLLGKEKSPYLQQHKDNPVWWQPWGDMALALAKNENKLIFLSIGYSTCHWCHVMEQESFEDPEVAEALNQNFIAIKVDREERPDVDDIYMTALHTMSQRGGWPLSMWLTPGGKPFYGGTYFPKQQFLSVLAQITKAWKDDPEKINGSSAELVKVLEENAVWHADPGTEDLDSKIFLSFIEQHEVKFDLNDGGFGPAPKFPQTMNLMALMRICLQLKDKKRAAEIEIWIKTTLDNMAKGGMFDHLAGGFHRYSTDKNWLVPHFEKMLYDNALLSLTYLEAYQKIGNAEYKRVATETLDYIIRDMSHEGGGYYSAEDADSLDPAKNHKEEGYFYVYSYDELQKLLSKEEFVAIQKMYGVTPFGNFERKNILNLQKGYSRKNKENPAVQTAFSKILHFRNSRPRPLLDKKILVSWNGLMITSMAKAYQVLGEKKYLESARAAATFILKHLYKNNVLSRRWIDGEAKVTAYSEDYAAMIQGLLALYQSDFDSQWLNEAIKLQAILDRKYWDTSGGGYYRDDGSDKTLLVRVKDDYDGVIPTSNSISALNLLKLHDLTFNKDYEEKANKIFQLFKSRLINSSLAIPNMVSALNYYQDRSKEVAVIGKSEDSTTVGILKYLRSEFLPSKVVAFLEDGTQSDVPLLKRKKTIGGKTTVYVCEGKVCQFPSSDLKKIKEMMELRTEF